MNTPITLIEAEGFLLQLYTPQEIRTFLTEQDDNKTWPDRFALNREFLRWFDTTNPPQTMTEAFWRHQCETTKAAITQLMQNISHECIVRITYANKTQNGVVYSIKGTTIGVKTAQGTYEVPVWKIHLVMHADGSKLPVI